MRLCCGCKARKPTVEFTRKWAGKKARRAQCRRCRSKDKKTWRKLNPKKEAAINARYAAKHPAKMRAKNKRAWRDPVRRARRQFTHRCWRLRKEYGLTELGYEALKQKQKGVCPICTKPLPKGLLAAVDHSHRTGKVRGLLHTTCNVALGMLKDDSENAKRAAKYLKSHV